MKKKMRLLILSSQKRQALLVKLRCLEIVQKLKRNWAEARSTLPLTNLHAQSLYLM